ncbi:MAG TPA: AraC family transcriptional regulator [Phycisphaerales bacterium]|nr:AraC family transcriptional regulator [Phycisphaerales bacterium]
MSNKQENFTPRRRDLQRRLAEQIAEAAPRDGDLEMQPGLGLFRRSGPTDPIHAFFKPSLCIIAQGDKEFVLGGERFHCGPAQYLICTVDLPMVCRIVQASRGAPYLSLRLDLDPATVTSVMMESGGLESRRDRSGALGVASSAADEELLDAAVRLVRLGRVPGDYRVLGPLVTREIVYRLLMGEQGPRMRHLATFAGQANRMVRALNRLRHDFTKPLRVDQMARELGMSVSGFHAHFKAVTAMSPLQFQKDLRLQEARRLMLSTGLDAGEAGYRVGYQDPAHFSREYKKHFGQPPARDVDRLRSLSVG